MQDVETEMRGVDGIYPAPALHWVGNGFRVAGYFSVIPDAARKLDPFLLLDYHPAHEYSATEHSRGVGVHPHRGFETVTLAFQGSVAHHDSSGGGGVIGPGDVQWMTAGAGILHKEFHEKEYARRGGAFQMAQLWVNLPRAHKMSSPRYQALLAGEMGIVELPGNAGTVRVIAGDYGGVRGPAETFTPIRLLDVTLREGAEFVGRFAARETLAVLVMRGRVQLQRNAMARENDFVLFQNQGDSLVVQALEESRLLILNGERIQEPIVQYGPFVMNSEREIQQAISDFRSGKFGQLADD